MEPFNKLYKLIKPHHKLSDSKHAWLVMEDKSFSKEQVNLFWKDNFSSNKWQGWQIYRSNKTLLLRHSIKMPFSQKETIKKRALLFNW